MNPKNCMSCAMLLTSDTQSANPIYCKHCADESGVLKTKEQIQAGIAYWLQMIQPELSNESSLKRAEYYLKAMPQWADA